MNRTVRTKKAIQKTFVCSLTVLFLVMASFSALAGAENPLKKENMRIKLMDDFKNYADVKDVVKGSLSTGATDKLAYSNGALSIFSDGNWQDLKFANFGLSQRGKMPGDNTLAEAGDFSGAEGIGIRIKLQSMSTFNVYFSGEANGSATFYQIKPDAPYYVIAKDGITNKALAVDTGYGFGTMGTLPARENYDCILLVPFTSLVEGSSGEFDPSAARISHMLYKTFGGNSDTGVILYSLFLYGENVEPFREEEIMNFFVQQDMVESPKDYTVPQFILNLRNAAPAGIGKIIRGVSIIVSVFSLVTAAAVVFISRKKHSSHPQGKENV